MMHKAAEAFIDEALTVIKKHNARSRRPEARGPKREARSTMHEAGGTKHEAERKTICELNYCTCPWSKV